MFSKLFLYNNTKTQQLDNKNIIAQLNDTWGWPNDPCMVHQHQDEDGA